MTILDNLIILLYFLAMLALGFWYRKKASQNLEAYFLGGKQMHWLPLSMSSSVSTFDITGTMWVVSLLFLMGMKSMWIHWMWGILMGAFFMAYMGKWVRRSAVMTGAEWMVTRFGDDRAGKLARFSYAVMAILFLTFMIGYAYQGIGKFASVYIPMNPDVLALIIIGSTTLYVVLGGLYSVVLTDVVQTVILTFASILISAIAFMQITPEILAQTLPQDWESLWPVWETDIPGYEMFGLLVIVWVLKGMIGKSGGPGQMSDFQRFLAARNDRDAAKLGGAWSFFLIVRWGMCMGIVLLALIGFSNVSDPEKVMPMVLQEFLPSGMKGLVIAGLLAAFMSTFSSTVNTAASYLVRDFWQPLTGQTSESHNLMRASYIATFAVVLAGMGIGAMWNSISDIWNWIMMALTSGILIPNVFRWYWWRMNGWSYAIGVFVGIIMSFVVLFFDNAPMYVVFPWVVIPSLLACIMMSYLTKPTNSETLITFYRTVRPFGAWGPIKRQSGLSEAELSLKSESFGLTAINVLLGMIAISGYYLLPMYLVGHWFTYAGICLAFAGTATVLLYFTWYRNLPAE